MSQEGQADEDNVIHAQLTLPVAHVGPLTYYSLARDYLIGGTAAVPKSEQRSLSSYSMLCQSVELSLKAFLVLHDVSRECLRATFGHDLSRLLDAAIERDLRSTVPLSQDEEAGIRLINGYYKDKLLSYPESLIDTFTNFPKRPEISMLRDAASTLVRGLEKPCLRAVNTPPKKIQTVKCKPGPHEKETDEEAAQYLVDNFSWVLRRTQRLYVTLPRWKDLWPKSWKENKRAQGYFEPVLLCLSWCDFLGALFLGGGKSKRRTIAWLKSEHMTAQNSRYADHAETLYTVFRCALAHGYQPQSFVISARRSETHDRHLTVRSNGHLHLNLCFLIEDLTAAVKSYATALRTKKRGHGSLGCYQQGWKHLNEDFKKAESRA